MKVVGEEALSELVEKIKQKSIQITPDDIEMIGDLMTSIQDLYFVLEKVEDLDNDVTKWRILSTPADMFEIIIGGNHIIFKPISLFAGSVIGQHWYGNIVRAGGSLEYGHVVSNWSDFSVVRDNIMYTEKIL